ncbi:hypothetical protein EXIGLDRAFT_779146 [Exidia glandulosa HHB12029]|uniref:Integral membrane protein n=1 Tax=Exidia glandulosa HHB12029 TaxID=1314781 RepID=A0A165C7H3_EXIGL|nr:hypothetical protein EXIGLDRAFT_779146 [Exidia glandulosa HHB12029]
MRITRSLAGALPFVASALAFEVPISHTQEAKQVCSGMWGGDNAYINLTFFPQNSAGQVAVVIYNWDDVEYLGRASSEPDQPPVYICTSRAVLEGLCRQADLGHFILDLPPGKTQTQTSIWSASIAFHPPTSRRQTSESATPTSTATATATPTAAAPAQTQIVGGGDAGRTMYYSAPIEYAVRKTGYYCVATVPVTVQRGARQDEADVVHGSYAGVVLFKNTFDGKLPATDYPKIYLYLALFLVYTILGAGWGWLCYKHSQDLLPIQNYISSLAGFLVIEMVAHWGYYRYLNAHGGGVSSTVFLIVVAILDAGRNALSFFLLLIVSLGLSVVRPSLGNATMRKCQLLAGAHFIFGMLYAIGIVELQLEQTPALVLLLFVIPLAFTLSTFLLWIMYALNGTIMQLAQRKQRFKLGMFKRLYWVLVGAVVVIMIFFVVSSMAFSNRMAEDYAANAWQSRWWLLDGWLALLYLVVFATIAYIWRPSENNARLAMSDELAQDEEEAEDYDMAALEDRMKGEDGEDDDDADQHTLVENGRRGRNSLGDDGVVFEIGDQDSDEEDEAHKRRQGRLSGEEATRLMREGGDRNV